MATIYKVMSNIPKMGQLPTPVFLGLQPSELGGAGFRVASNWVTIENDHL